MDEKNLRAAIKMAATAIREAEALIIGAGAGMGVDSGLPDFRGDEGFWKAYPPFHKLGLRFIDLAQPHWFERDPELAWGFYGHRLELYRETTPHRGFTILQSFAERVGESFVYTSNVDGQFQKAGFERIVECHGSIHQLQCIHDCRDRIWPALGVRITVDEATMRASGMLPSCLDCGELARPNIVMFGDMEWNGQRSQEQYAALRDWENRNRNRRKVVIECGAGTAIPSVRGFCQRAGGSLIRINLRESQGPQGIISLPMRALEALEAIAAEL